MKLLTAAIIKKLEKNPLYSSDGEYVVPVLVKFFTPDSSWTWYVVEAKFFVTEDNGGDWEFFGLVEGHEKELGYFRLSDLQSVRGNIGLPVERDMYFDGMVLDKTNNEVRKA
jgi:Protein of unknown function (DUF2958)